MIYLEASFAYEDKVLRDFLVEQARNENSPFEFIDMSVKDPWESCWKTNCRAKIKMCDGVIAIITNNTKKLIEKISAYNNIIYFNPDVELTTKQKINKYISKYSNVK